MFDTSFRRQVQIDKCHECLMKKASKHLLILWLFFASTKVKNFRQNILFACDKSLQLLNHEIMSLFNT